MTARLLILIVINFAAVFIKHRENIYTKSSVSSSDSSMLTVSAHVDGLTAVLVYFLFYTQSVMSKMKCAVKTSMLNMLEPLTSRVFIRLLFNRGQGHDALRHVCFSSFTLRKETSRSVWRHGSVNFREDENKLPVSPVLRVNPWKFVFPG